MTSELNDDSIKKDYQFPKDFIFGVSTSAYQIEGGWNEDGKGESIWDRAAHHRPDLIYNKDSGDIACDSYHLYKEDVQNLKSLGVNFYRFSISWTRILPNGRNTNVNQNGIDYYNNLINELLREGITPYVTMYHWDLPQSLQDDGGWLNRKTADYFVDYAKILFEHFGDRVKHWITFNETFQFCEQAYGSPLGESLFAPFISKPGIGGYEATHTVLLAHGKTYRLYEKYFKNAQKGMIGFSVDGVWFKPVKPDDVNAADTAIRMVTGWILHPLTTGNYPPVMIDRVRKNSKEEGFLKSRLPEFSPEEQSLLRGTIDFVGCNFFIALMCQVSDSLKQKPRPSYNYDSGVDTYLDPSWPSTGCPWARYAPWALFKLLTWIKNNYDNVKILITENGLGNQGQLEDHDRVNYIRSYLYEVLRAIHEEKCDIIGYSFWSLMDNLEWSCGYSIKFGLYHVDFDDEERKRTKKLSAYIYEDIIAKRRIDWTYSPQVSF